MFDFFFNTACELHCLIIDWHTNLFKFQFYPIIITSSFYWMAKPVQLILTALSNFPSGCNIQWKSLQFKKLYLSVDLLKKEFTYNTTACSLLFSKASLPISELLCWLWKLIALNIYEWEEKKGRIQWVRIGLQDKQWHGCGIIEN